MECILSKTITIILESVLQKFYCSFYFLQFQTEWIFFVPTFLFASIYFIIFVISYCVMGFFAGQMIVTVHACLTFVGIQLKEIEEKSKDPNFNIKEALKKFVDDHCETIELSFKS